MRAVMKDDERANEEPGREQREPEREHAGDPERETCRRDQPEYGTTEVRRFEIPDRVAAPRKARGPHARIFR